MSRRPRTPLIPYSDDLEEKLTSFSPFVYVSPPGTIGFPDTPSSYTFSEEELDILDRSMMLQRKHSLLMGYSPRYWAEHRKPSGSSSEKQKIPSGSSSENPPHGCKPDPDQTRNRILIALGYLKPSEKLASGSSSENQDSGSSSENPPDQDLGPSSSKRL